MRKIPLTDCQMFSDAACVNAASKWTEVIVMDHYRGPGDMDNALHAAARETKLPHGFIWKLRYRRSSVKLPPFDYMLKLAVAYGQKRRQGAKARDPMADALAAEFLKLAETFRGIDADIYRSASAGLLSSAHSLGADIGGGGEAGRAVARGGEA